MHKTLATALLTPVMLGALALPADAHGRLYANQPRLSGSADTGRIVATCKNTKGLGWGQRRMVQIRVDRLERTVRNGKPALAWIPWVAPPGGKRTSSGAFDAHWTAAAFPGRYITRCREIVFVNGIPRFGKWTQSQATTVNPARRW